jgi:hypothetical protein
MALASPIGALRFGVYAANIDLLANGSSMTDRNGPISMNLDNGKRALERQELLLNGRLANVDQIINVVIVGDARFIFGNIIVMDLGLAAAITVHRCRVQP